MLWNGSAPRGQWTSRFCFSVWLLLIVLAACAPRALIGQAVSVTPTPTAVTIFPGQQNVPVSISLGQGSYTGPIAVTLTGVPSGITVAPLSLMAGALQVRDSMHIKLKLRLLPP